MKCFTTIGLVFVLSALALSGCSVKKKLDEMHDATLNLDTNTKKLGTTSDGIKETSDGIKETSEDLDAKTAELYDALKQGDALASRRAAFRTMIDAKEAPHKIGEASKYFMSLEVQLWSGLGQDNDEKRMQLAALAAREFFIDVQEFIVGQNLIPQPLAHGATAKSNRTMCLNALSVAMHMVNPKQEIMLKANKDQKAISMYSMIEHSLTASRQIASGTAKASDFPLYVKEILTYEDIAVLLMQSRYNYFPVLALGRLVPQNKIKANVVKARAKILGRLIDKVTDTELTTDLSQFNVFEIREFTTYFRDSMKAHDLLVSVSQKPLLDSELRGMMSQMQMKKSDGETLTANGLAEKPAAEADLVDLMARFTDSGK
jgi:hypothetical protein